MCYSGEDMPLFCDSCRESGAKNQTPEELEKLEAKLKSLSHLRMLPMEERMSRMEEIIYRVEEKAQKKAAIKDATK